MNRPPLLDEEGDDLEIDIDTGDEDYEPLDFDSEVKFDRATEPELWEEIQDILDILEDEQAKDEIDKEEEEILRQLVSEEEEE